MRATQRSRRGGRDARSPGSRSAALICFHVQPTPLRSIQRRCVGERASSAASGSGAGQRGGLGRSYAHGDHRDDCRATAAAPLPPAAVRRSVAPAAAAQGAGVDRGDRRGRRRARAARRRRRRVVLGPVGRAHRDRPRLPRRRMVAADGPDHAHGARLVLDPARGVSGRAAALPAGARRLRHRRGAERLPAGQHRHVRDAADVRGDHGGRELRGRPRRDARAEDLLHARRRVRLRLPVRDRAGDVRPPVRAAARQPPAVPADRGQRRDADRRARAHLPAQAARSGREGQAGRRDPREPAGVPRARRAAVAWRLARQARRDRRVPRRLRDHGHVPHA